MIFDQKAAMAVVENAALDLGLVVRASSPPPFDVNGAGGNDQDSSNPSLRDHLRLHQQLSLNARQYSPTINVPRVVGLGQPEKKMSGFDLGANGVGEVKVHGDGAGGYHRGVKELEEMFSKLNPMAEEFVPPSLTNPSYGLQNGFYISGFGLNQSLRLGNRGVNRSVGGRMRVGYNQCKRRTSGRTTMAQREEIIRRTVFVSDIDQQVTEEQLATLFVNCGQVVDCRICGDPNSVLRFAFVEFTDEEGAQAALTLSGTTLGYFPVKVLPSKTAIVPVNPNLLPQNEDERDMCARTIYCTNIDKKVSQSEVKLFFESVCGQVHHLRLLGDYNHSTRIAFVEFVMAESAVAALNCSGVFLGSLAIRVSPSKTPVRPRGPRTPGH